MNFTNNQIIAFYKNVNYTEKITFCFVLLIKKKNGRNAPVFFLFVFSMLLINFRQASGGPGGIDLFELFFKRFDLFLVDGFYFI